MPAILSCLHTNSTKMFWLLIDTHSYIVLIIFGVFLECYYWFFLFLEFIKGDSVPGCLPFCHVYIQIVPKLFWLLIDTHSYIVLIIFGVFLERYYWFFLFLEFIKGDSVPGCLPFCHVYIKLYQNVLIVDRYPKNN